jgi:hypothetical protein
LKDPGFYSPIIPQPPRAHKNEISSERGKQKIHAMRVTALVDFEKI